MSMMNTVLSMAIMFGSAMADMEERNKKKCDDLIDQYKNLQNLPRKKKKKEKKLILLEYSIFSYDPLTNKQYNWA